MNDRIHATARQKQHVTTVLSCTLLAAIALLGVVAARKLLHSEEPRVDAPTSAGKVLGHQTGFQTDRLPKVDAQMRFYIGEHDGIEHPFDHNMYRAYFYWYWGKGDALRTQSFSVEQLKELIAERKARGGAIDKFELALARLQGMNSRTASL